MLCCKCYDDDLKSSSTIQVVKEIVVIQTKYLE